MIYLKLNFSSLFFHRLLRYYLFLIIFSITRLQALISFLLLLLLISILHFRNGFYWAWVETNDNYVYIFTSHMSLNIDVVCMFWESRGKQWLYVHKYVNVVDFIETSVHCNIHTYTSAYSLTYASIWNYTYYVFIPSCFSLPAHSELIQVTHLNNYIFLHKFLPLAHFQSLTLLCDHPLWEPKASPKQHFSGRIVFASFRYVNLPKSLELVS